MNYQIAVVLLTSLLACGGKKKEAPKTKQDAGANGPTVAPISTPTIGVDSIKRMNFTYGDAMREYDKVLAAYKTKNWPAVRTACEQTLAKDPYHLDAHRILASALAQAGEHAAAVDHLVTALAGDYLKYAPNLRQDPDLEGFFATPHGTAITEVAERIHAELVKRATAGILVIGRRSSFRWPRESGVQTNTSRGEVYAFDRETRRYLRLTHTEHQVAAVLRAPSGGELAVFGFDKTDRPKGDDVTPLVSRSWVQLVDTAAWTPIGKRVQVGGGREIHLGYAAGDQLLVATAPASGRWGIGEVAIASLDKAAGKLTKVRTELPVPRFAFSLEEGRVIGAATGVIATWSGDPPTTPVLAVAGGPEIHIPESGQAARSTVALAPDKLHLAFATATDPCAQDTSPSLYVADTKTGALKHVLTAKSRFATRWVDATTLAYEDGDGAIRVWDATTGREATKLENKVGIALEVLSLAPAPLCKGAPPAAEQVGSGSASSDEPPLPPEEPAGSGSDGPVTSPR